MRDSSLSLAGNRIDSRNRCWSVALYLQRSLAPTEQVREGRSVLPDAGAKQLPQRHQSTGPTSGSLVVLSETSSWSNNKIAVRRARHAVLQLSQRPLDAVSRSAPEGEHRRDVGAPRTM